MSLRACRRAVVLAFVLLKCIVRFWLLRLNGPRTLERRAGWLQKTCVEVLWSLEISLSVEGQPPMISGRLKLLVPVLFFPEGTSTDGTSVLRFHSRLFEPAIVAGAPITAASVRYVIEAGTPEREICWYGDDTFGGHMVKTLNSAPISAIVRFGEPRVYANRRVAAHRTHDEVAAMRGHGAGVERGSALTAPLCPID